MNDKLKVGITGLGMVGTPLARYLCEYRSYKQGRDLFLFDKNPKKGFNDDINLAQVIFVAVPSPRSADGSADLSIVESVFSSIQGKKIVVIKSTVPPGTAKYFQKKYPKIKVLFNPEFLTEKNSWQDFIKPDRQIVGFVSPEDIKLAQKVLSILPLAPFVSPKGKIKITATEAEIIKYGGNVYLSRKVNFANILADASLKLGADYENIRLGLTADPRIGPSHLDVLHAGYRGFGGYCFPKDLDAFIAAIKSLGLKRDVDLLAEDRNFNKNLLAEQGLTIKDVSVHDQEWVKKKTKNLYNKK